MARSPKAQRCPFFQVPSSSVVDVFPGVSDSAKGDTQHKDQNMFFQCCLEEDPLFAHQVQSLERMLRVRERLASGARHSGCGNGGDACAAPVSRHALALADYGSARTAVEHKESEVGSGEHDSHDSVSECGSGKTALLHKGSEIQRPEVPSCVVDADSPLSRSCQRALPDGVGGCQS